MPEIYLDLYWPWTHIIVMAKFRLGSIANLARQLAFTPHDLRAVQIVAAESLLHDIRVEKAYPFDFVVYRITGYQPKLAQECDQLTGIALQHDLGLLIEQVSATLDLHTRQIFEPVLSIDDVTVRFDVTSKTIQRWRRKGLPARRFIFPDGKNRIGFLLSSVERFISVHASDVCPATVSTAMDGAEQTAIVRHARRLALACKCDLDQICLRIGKKFHRSPLNILHTLRKHDESLPHQQVLGMVAESISSAQQSRIVRGWKRGLRLKRLSRKLKLGRYAVYHAVMKARVEQLNGRKVRFKDDPLYHEHDAFRMIEQIVAQDELAVTANAAEYRTPRDLPPYLRDLYRVALLTPAAERALFLKFNFHKYQFVSARRKLEPQFAKSRDLDQLETFLSAATETKNQILSANLRLVVSVARRHVRPGITLMELISEGNIILMRSVEGFDIHKGNRFSTYATLALMKGFAQAVPAIMGQSMGMVAASGSNAGNRVFRSRQTLSAIPDDRNNHVLNRQSDRDQIEHLLRHLDARERRVLQAHYGLEQGGIPVPYEQVAAELGLSKQRVRQIEQTAITKLRLQCK